MKKKELRALNKEKKKQIKEENKIISKKYKRERKKLEREPNVLNDFQGKITSKIPEKMILTIEKTFEEGFKLVLDKGIENIDKISPTKRINDNYDQVTNSLELEFTKKEMKKITSLGSKRGNVNKITSAITGGGLGVLGIMLPDIPLFIAMIIKSINEICNVYGKSINSNTEEIYALYIICMALSESNESYIYNEKLNEIENEILNGDIIHIDKDDVIKETSSLLVKNIAGSKFVQNIPIVGIVGGVTNFNILNKINKTAKTKYKRRFLNIFMNF